MSKSTYDSYAVLTRVIPLNYTTSRHNLAHCNAPIAKPYFYLWLIRNVQNADIILWMSVSRDES